MLLDEQYLAKKVRCNHRLKGNTAVVVFQPTTLGRVVKAEYKLYAEVEAGITERMGTAALILRIVQDRKAL